MQIQFFKTLWGHTGSFEDAVAQAIEHNFSGIEAPLPVSTGVPILVGEQLAHRAQLLALHKLDWILEVCTAGSYVPDRRASVEQHLQDLKHQLVAALPYKPKFVNVLGGCDAWSQEQSYRFFSQALEFSAAFGITLSFETHRGRSFFNPWTTLALIEKLPALKLTCDFSHWCVVCERLIDTEIDILKRIAVQAHHIHGRVGYDQGPQVPHPAAPEYAEALLAHRSWWELIWASQIKRGYAVTTMTPEFGPDGYLHQLPFSKQPVAELWQINTWMAQTELAHFNRFKSNHLSESKLTAPAS